MSTTLHVHHAEATVIDNFAEAVEFLRGVIDADSRTVSIMVHGAPWRFFDDGCTVNRANAPRLCLVRKHKFGAVDVTLFSPFFQPDEPVHRPLAADAPIPGFHHYASCDPDRPTVAPDGVCRGCGENACPDCGNESCDCAGAVA